MTYIYKCNQCKKTTELNFNLGENLPRNMECPFCKKGIMNQDLKSKFKSMNLVIPCTFNDETYMPKDMGEGELEEYIGSLD